MKKVLYFISFVFALAFANPESDGQIKPRFCENKLMDFTECIRNVLEEGLPEVGLPSLNPLLITNTTIDLDSTGIHALAGNIFIRELEVNGITKWQIENLVMKTDMIGGIGIKLSANVKFEKIQMDSKMVFDGILSGKQLLGDGEFGLGVEELDVSILVRIKLSDMSLKELKIEPKYKSIPYYSKDLMVGNMKLEDYITLHKEDLKEILEYIMSLLQKPSFANKQISQRADILEVIIAILEECPVDDFIECLPL